MPPVFAQPSIFPVGHVGFGGGGGGGFGAGEFASMARSLQDRYANDAALGVRAGLGYAGLAEEHASRQADFDLRAANLAMQPGLQAQQADLQIQNWMFQQRFTQQDQQDLARQYTVVSELQDKLDKGEITQNEFYRMLGQAAPRINYLAAKEQHTRNKALEQQRQQQASLFEEQRQRLSILNALQSGEMEGQIDQYVLPENKQALSEHMQLVHPGLQSGSPEYEAQSKLEASQMGWSMDMVKVPGKGLVPLQTIRGLMGGPAGTGAS